MQVIAFYCLIDIYMINKVHQFNGISSVAFNEKYNYIMFNVHLFSQGSCKNKETPKIVRADRTLIKKYKVARTKVSF